MVQGRMIEKIVRSLAKFSAATASAVTVVAFLCGVAQAADIQAEAVPGEFVVKAKNARAFKALSTQVMPGAEGIRVITNKQNLFVVKRNILERAEHVLTELSANPNIEIAEPNYIYRINRLPNDPKLGDLWGLKNSAQKGGRVGMDINAEGAWEIQTGNPNIVVAVIDTGLDYTHEDLASNSWVNAAELNGVTGVDDDKNGYVDDIHGYDFVNNDGDPMDDHGHGTHVSGTIGAKGDDGKGIVGVSWNVRIMGVKFLSAEGSGTLEDAIKAIDYATANGAMIESNSWGGGGFSQLLKESIERSRDKNVVFVAAAGNESNDNDTSPSYPASYEVENVISVAAVNNGGSLASFSSYGKTSVHVAAPGVDVMSSVPKKTDPSGYATWSGTSMATPHVSGVAALLLAHVPGMNYSEVKARLMKSCRPLTALRTKTACGGMVDAYYALLNEEPGPDMEDPFNWASVAREVSTPHPYQNKTNNSFEIKVEGAKQVAVYFEKFETERSYDFVQFKNATGEVIDTWSGGRSGEFSPTVNGDTIYITFKSDDSVTGYGFSITKAAFR